MTTGERNECVSDGVAIKGVDSLRLGTVYTLLNDTGRAPQQFLTGKDYGFYCRREAEGWSVQVLPFGVQPTDGDVLMEFVIKAAEEGGELSVMQVGLEPGDSSVGSGMFAALLADMDGAEFAQCDFFREGGERDGGRKFVCRADVVNPWRHNEVDIVVGNCRGDFRNCGRFMASDRREDPWRDL